MVIGIDANEANVEKRVGISEYAFQIIRQLYRLRKESKISHEFIIYLKSEPLKGMPEEMPWWKYKIVKPAKLWTQIALPLNLLFSKTKLDVFFTTTHYAPRFSKFPTIVSVMDLSYLHFPDTFKKDDLYQLKNWTSYSVNNAKKVVTISKSSKNDIIKFYNIKAENIAVVPLGLKKIDESMTLKKDLSDFGVKDSYILYVGTIQPRKNIAKLIEAYSTLEEEIQEKYQLVIVGKKGWLYEEILQAPEKFNVKDRVLFLDYVKDNDLPSFYKKAALFVLPSLYEGFGLPILEAMRYDCPVVASNVSSLPEAGGDAALYFDPNNTTEMAKTIEKVLRDSDLRKKMVEKGREHYKKFTWERAAEKVIKTIEEAVKEK